MTDTILDLTRLLPGPLATRMLADMGFRVHRVLPPQGDLTAKMNPELYDWLGVGKTLETVDLKTEDGKNRLKALVSDAQVLVETNRPGVMENLGLGPEVLRAINPKLAYVRIAGYRDEAFRSAPGHDLTYLAATGLLDRFEPAWRHVQLADGTGAFWGVIAVLDALRRGGGFYEVYLAEAARALGYPKLAELDGRMVCYAVFPAKEGDVAVAGLEPHLWLALCQAVGRPEWAAEGFSPTDDGNPVYREMLAMFAERTADEWETLAREQSLPLRKVHPYETPAGLLPWRRVE